MVKWNTFLWLLDDYMCTRKGEIMPVQITNKFNGIVCENIFFPFDECWKVAVHVDKDITHLTCIQHWCTVYSTLSCELDCKRKCKSNCWIMTNRVNMAHQNAQEHYKRCLDFMGFSFHWKFETDLVGPFPKYVELPSLVMIKIAVFCKLNWLCTGSSPMS